MSNLKLRHFAEMFEKSMKSSMLVSMISSSLVFGRVHPAQAIYGFEPKPMHQDIVAKKQEVQMPQDKVAKKQEVQNTGIDPLTLAIIVSVTSLSGNDSD